MKKTLSFLIGIALLVCVVWYTNRKLGPVKPVQQNATAAVAPTVAPALMLKDLRGNSVNLADLRGKVVFLDFWATWCEPCKIEIPWLIELQTKYASRGFTIVGIAMDDGGQKVVDPFVQQTHFDVNGQQQLINYPVVVGSDEIIEKIVPDFVGFPTGVLISRDGKIVKTTLGLVSFDEIDKSIVGQLQVSEQSSNLSAAH